VPQRAKPADQAIVDELLARQDNVIGELEKLESQILDAIETLNASRQEEIQSAISIAEQSDTLRMPQPDQEADGNGDQSSRAA